jgi:alpha-beta hydrolase superfamily lysophospholipase
MSASQETVRSRFYIGVNRSIFSRSSLKRLVKVLFTASVIGMIALNVMAWMHARAMTHFIDAGIRTSKPETLSFPQKVWTLLTGVNIPKPMNLSSPTDHGLLCETHVIRELNDVSLEAWFVPNPEQRALVIMFHGYAACKSDLLVPAAQFHSMGCEVLLVDFHGSGGSSGNDTGVGVSESKDVAQSIDYATAQWPNRRIVLYGVSMGSAAILRAIAFEGAAPNAVIIESPFDSLINTARNRFKLMGLPTFPAAQLLVFWGGVQQGFNGFRHNPAEYARSVKCPVLMLHGERDSRVTVEQARNIFDNLGGEKRFKLFDVGHEVIAVAQPEEWRAQVIEFLDGL